MRELSEDKFKCIYKKTPNFQNSRSTENAAKICITENNLIEIQLIEKIMIRREGLQIITNKQLALKSRNTEGYI